MEDILETHALCKRYRNFTASRASPCSSPATSSTSFPASPRTTASSTAAAWSRKSARKRWELEACCRKCMRLDVSDTRALARVLDRQKAEYRIVDDTHADLYTELPVTELVLALDKERCAVRSFKERDESLESFYMDLIGGVRHA